MSQSITRPSRVHRTPQQWQALIDEWQQSGESAKQFCIARSIGYASFCQWRKRLTQPGQSFTRKQQAAPAPEFIDLATLSAGSTGAWHIVLNLGNGVELTLSQR